MPQHTGQISLEIKDGLQEHAKKQKSEETTDIEEKKGPRKLNILIDERTKKKKKKNAKESRKRYSVLSLGWIRSRVEYFFSQSVKDATFVSNYRKNVVFSE